MTTVDVLVSVMLIGLVATVYGSWHYSNQAEINRAEALYQLERYLHTNFPVGSTHELKGYSRVQLKRHSTRRYLDMPNEVTFRTAGGDGSYLRGESVTMSWRLFQELLIEESEE